MTDGLGAEGQVFAQEVVSQVKKSVDADPSLNIRLMLKGTLKHIQERNATSSATIIKFENLRKKNRLTAITLGTNQYLIIRPLQDTKGSKFSYLYKSHQDGEQWGHKKRRPIENAEVTVHDVMENDIVILLSDGAANNLDDVTF